MSFMCVCSTAGTSYILQMKVTCYQQGVSFPLLAWNRQLALSTALEPCPLGSSLKWPPLIILDHGAGEIVPYIKVLASNPASYLLTFRDALNMWHPSPPNKYQTI